MEQIITKYFWVFNILTLALVSYLLADGTGELIAAEISQSLPSPAKKLKIDPRSRAKPQTAWTRPDGSDILARNIFDSISGPLGRFSAVPPSPSTDADTDELVDGYLPLIPCPAGKVKLMATVASRYTPEWSFASIMNNKTAVLCRVGDEVDGRIVSGITWRFLFLESKTDECYMDLFRDPKAAKKPKRTAKKAVAKGDDIKDGIQKVSETEHNVDRVVVDRLLADPTKFIRTVRVRPHKVNGKMVGYKLRRFQAKSPIALLGAKKGDIIRAVNGTPLTSVDQALGAYQGLRSASDLTFSITRGGKEMDLKVNVR
jgi:hypothetical protein